MKIFILMGGASSEKNISIKTANAIIGALSRKYTDIIPISMSFNDLSFINQIQNGDIIFNALHGGQGENGDLQSILEFNNIIYTGSDSRASKICINKHLSKLVAKSEGINTPDWVLYKNANFAKQKLFNAQNNNKFSYPYIVKPNEEGSTVGLTKVDEESQLDFAISMALEFSNQIMIEEYIPGREITVGILGNKPLPIVEIFPKKDFFDYECKYSHGMSEYQVPAKVNKSIALKIQKDAVKLHESIGCKHYSRVDFILDENNQHHFLEINSLPGMTETSLFPMAAKEAGVDFEDLVNIILNMALLNND